MGILFGRPKKHHTIITITENNFTSSTFKKENKKRKPKKPKKLIRKGKKSRRRPDSTPFDAKDFLPPPIFQKFKRKSTPSISDHILLANTSIDSTISFWEPVDESELVSEEPTNIKNRRSSMSHRGNNKSNLYGTYLNVFVQNETLPIRLKLSRESRPQDLIKQALCKKLINGLPEGSEWKLHTITTLVNKNSHYFLHDEVVDDSKSLFDLMNSNSNEPIRLKLMLKKHKIYSVNPPVPEKDDYTKSLSLRLQVARRKLVRNSSLMNRGSSITKRMSLLNFMRPMLLYRAIILLDTQIANFGRLETITTDVSPETTVENIIYDCIMKLAERQLPKTEFIDGIWILKDFQNGNKFHPSENAMEALEKSSKRLILTLEQIDTQE